MNVGDLVRFGVLVRSGDGLSVNQQMLEFKERWDRCFLAQRCRSQLLWHGGVYSTAALLAPEARYRTKEEGRLLKLQPALLAAEEAAAKPDADEELIDFLHGYIWGASRVLRLLLMLVAMGELDAARYVAGLLHRNIRLSKGIEDIFAALRPQIRNNKT